MKLPPAGMGLPFAALASMAGALTIAAAVPPVVRRIRARRSPGAARWPERWFVAEALACAIAVGVFVAVYNAAKENRRSPRPFAETVWRLVSDGGLAPAPGRALYRAGLPPTVAFYLPLDTGREDAARTVVVVGGKNARAADVSANYAKETGQTVTEARSVPLDDRSNPDRWTLFELTLANPRRFASSE
jgi:hypothetical protein